MRAAAAVTLFGELLVFLLSGCPNPFLKNTSTSIAPPVISPGGGVFGTDQSVSLTSAVSGAAIYYTTDGSTPTTSSVKYSGPIAVAGNGTVETIKAIDATGGGTSEVVQASFTINYSIGGTSTLAAPTFSVSSGVYATAQTVVISDAASAATIYYTTNGTTPSASSYTGTGPGSGVTVTTSGTNGSTTTLRAVAAESGFISSTVVTASYEINETQVSTPQFSTASPPGVYTSDQTNILLSVPSAPSGTTIYYTVTNGTTGTTPTPGVSPTLTYSAPLSVTGNGTIETIEAMATAPGYSNSTVTSGTYVIAYPTEPTPVFSLSSGAYSTPQSGITLTVPAAPPGTTIYYTTSSGWSGAVPTTGSTAYSAPLSTTGTGTVETFEAVATAPGYAQSGVATVTYVITPYSFAFTVGGSLTIPSGVTQVTVKLWGGGGGGGWAGLGVIAPGGGGGFVEQTLSVTAGETLAITVGGGGAAPAACTTGGGGGAGGGGMSAVSLGNLYYAIAGGGGGGGAMGSGTGGAGGAAGVAGGNNSFGLNGGSPGTDGTGTAGVSGGIAGAGGGGSAAIGVGSSGGATGGGNGGYFPPTAPLYMAGGQGGAGYGGGGGGGAYGTSPPGVGAGGGGGGNYGSIIFDGSGATPGGVADPDYPGGSYGYGGTPASGSCGTSGNQGYVVVYLN